MNNSSYYYYCKRRPNVIKYYRNGDDRMKNFKKISAILLSVLILSLSILPSLAAVDAADLAITNPYVGADFETFNQYK